MRAKGVVLDDKMARYILAGSAKVVIESKGRLDWWPILLTNVRDMAVPPANGSYLVLPRVEVRHPMAGHVICGFCGHRERSVVRVVPAGHTRIRCTLGRRIFLAQRTSIIEWHWRTGVLAHLSLSRHYLRRT